MHNICLNVFTMMVTYPFQGIDLDSEDSEYDAYTFYQLLEQKTSHSHILVEDIRVIEPQTIEGPIKTIL